MSEVIEDESPCRGASPQVALIKSKLVRERHARAQAKGVPLQVRVEELRHGPVLSRPCRVHRLRRGDVPGRPGGRRRHRQGLWSREGGRERAGCARGVELRVVQDVAVRVILLFCNVLA